MIRRVVKHDCVTGIAQERRPARHQGQDALCAFLTQILLDAGEMGHPADQGLGLMDVQIITDEMEAEWP